MSLEFIISSFKEDMEPVQCRCGLTTKIMMSTTTKKPWEAILWEC
jgi:hypothetical protein